MSAGTFSLMPGPASVSIDAGSVAGTITPGVNIAGTTSVTSPFVYAGVASRIAKAPIAVLQDAYMRAVRDFCKRSQWLRRNVPVAAATINQPAYNFGADPLFEVIDCAAAQVQQLPPSNNWVDLHSTSQDTFDPNQANDIPNWYAYLPEGTIIFYPTPNLAYNLKVELAVGIQLSATVIPNDLITKFNLYLEAGARWHLFLMKDQPWFDPMLALQEREEFMEGIGMAKSLKDKGNQSGAVRAKPRPFISR